MEDTNLHNKKINKRKQHDSTPMNSKNIRLLLLKVSFHSIAFLFLFLLNHNDLVDRKERHYIPRPFDHRIFLSRFFRFAVWKINLLRNVFSVDIHQTNYDSIPFTFEKTHNIQPKTRKTSDLHAIYRRRKF